MPDDPKTPKPNPLAGGKPDKAPAPLPHASGAATPTPRVGPPTQPLGSSAALQEFARALSEPPPHFPLHFEDAITQFMGSNLRDYRLEPDGKLTLTIQPDGLYRRQELAKELGLPYQRGYEGNKHVQYAHKMVALRKELQQARQTGEWTPELEAKMQQKFGLRDITFSFYPAQLDAAKAAQFTQTFNPVSNHLDPRNFARLVPGMEEVYTNPHAADPAKVAAVFNQALAELEQRTQTFSEKFQQPQYTPQQLHSLLQEAEALHARFQNLTIFATGIAMVHGRQSRPIELALQPSMPALAYLQQAQQQQQHALIAQLLGHEPGHWANLMAQHPPLAEYDAYLRQARATYISPEAYGSIDMENFIEAQHALNRYIDPYLPQDKRDAAQAESFSRLARYKREMMLAAGFSDSMQQFAAIQQTPADAVDAIDLHARAMQAQLNSYAISLSLETRHDKTHQYTWQEAQDIVAESFARLDPRLGELARRAYREGWVQVRRGCTQPGMLPIASEPGGAQPILDTAFHGHVEDVVVLGHETAHLLARHLGNARHGVFSGTRTLLTEEAFSHVSELLVEETMMARASTPMDRNAILKNRLDRRGVTPSTMIYGDFERKLFSHPTIAAGGTLSYTEMERLYRASFVKYGIETPASLRDFQALTQFLNPAPHYALVYPIATELAPVIHAALVNDPARLGPVFYDALAGGAEVTVNQLWQTFTGLPPEAMGARLADGGVDFAHLGPYSLKEATPKQIEIARRRSILPSHGISGPETMLHMPEGSNGYLAFSGIRHKAYDTTPGIDPAADWKRLFGAVTPEEMYHTLSRGLPKSHTPYVEVHGPADPSAREAILDELEKDYIRQSVETRTAKELQTFRKDKAEEIGRYQVSLKVANAEHKLVGSLHLTVDPARNIASWASGAVSPEAVGLRMGHILPGNAIRLSQQLGLDGIRCSSQLPAHEDLPDNSLRTLLRLGATPLLDDWESFRLYIAGRKLEPYQAQLAANPDLAQRLVAILDSPDPRSMRELLSLRDPLITPENTRTTLSRLLLGQQSLLRTEFSLLPGSEHLSYYERSPLAVPPLQMLPLHVTRDMQSRYQHEFTPEETRALQIFSNEVRRVAARHGVEDPHLVLVFPQDFDELLAKAPHLREHLTPWLPKDKKNFSPQEVQENEAVYRQNLERIRHVETNGYGANFLDPALFDGKKQNPKNARVIYQLDYSDLYTLNPADLDGFLQHETGHILRKDSATELKFRHHIAASSQLMQLRQTLVNVQNDPKQMAAFEDAIRETFGTPTRFSRVLRAIERDIVVPGTNLAAFLDANPTERHLVDANLNDHLQRLPENAVTKNHIASLSKLIQAYYTRASGLDNAASTSHPLTEQLFKALEPVERNHTTNEQRRGDMLRAREWLAEQFALDHVRDKEAYVAKVKYIGIKHRESMQGRPIHEVFGKYDHPGENIQDPHEYGWLPIADMRQTNLLYGTHMEPDIRSDVLQAALKNGGKIPREISLNPDRDFVLSRDTPGTPEWQMHQDAIAAEQAEEQASAQKRHSQQKLGNAPAIGQDGEHHSTPSNVAPHLSVRVASRAIGVSGILNGYQMYRQTGDAQYLHASAVGMATTALDLFPRTKFLGGNPIVQLAADGVITYHAVQSGQEGRVGQALGGGAGGLLGGMAGSVVPGLGNLVGATMGATFGRDFGQPFGLMRGDTKEEKTLGATGLALTGTEYAGYGGIGGGLRLGASLSKGTGEIVTSLGSALAAGADISQAGLTQLHQVAQESNPGFGAMLRTQLTSWTMAQAVLAPFVKWQAKLFGELGEQLGHAAAWLKRGATGMELSHGVAEFAIADVKKAEWQAQVAAHEQADLAAKTRALAKQHAATLQPVTKLLAADKAHLPAMSIKPPEEHRVIH